MDLPRTLTLALSVAILVGYILWKWRQAGQYVASQNRDREAAQRYFDRLRRDPRWLAMQSKLEDYCLSFDRADVAPTAYAVQKIALVCDQGFMYRIDNETGPTHIAGVLERKQPASRVIVKMNLQTGELQEHMAPRGAAFAGPPR